MYDGQQTAVETAKAVWEEAVTSYVETCSWDVILEQLLPDYKSYQDDYDEFVTSSEREKAAFRFKKPANPRQSILDILKDYKPDSNDASIA